MSSVGAIIVSGQARETLRSEFLSLGFDVVRFANAEAQIDGIGEWLEAGHHADMAWLERTAEKRRRVDLVLPGARSLVLLGVNYWPGSETSRLNSTAPVWARYSLHADYHDTMRPGLVAAGKIMEERCGLTPSDYRYYVDTGPVLERGWAARSGMGFLGKNGMLISRQFGNWLFLSALLTRAEIEPDPPLRKAALPSDGREPVGLLCGKCTRCIDACPTQAIPEPGVIDARRCISYQTIENKRVIPRELRAAIGSRIYGCDICLEVCPWNRFAKESRRLLLSARGDIEAISLGEILTLTPERFATVFKGTAIKRLKRAGLLRNASVVAGNIAAGHGEGSELLAPLLRLATQEVAFVRAHAVWAIRRIAGESATRILAGSRALETEPSVLLEYDADLD